MAASSWDQLSDSSRRSLLWAGALARYRAEQNAEDANSAAADSFDLLVGMLLEHPENAEPLILLDHFHLVPGQVLPADYPRPAADSIERHMRAVTADDLPPLQPDARQIVTAGMELGLRSGNPQVAELPALFAAMLQATDSPVGTALENLLAQRHPSPSEIGLATAEYVQQQGAGAHQKSEDGSAVESYADFLEQRFPFSPNPVDIPNYKADHGQASGLSGDMVGIRAEVDAFAYLLASRGLTPPLAVGLFGDWGSGKSFFMDAVRRRIEQLTHYPDVAERRQSEVPFWKRVIQIEFNAWHYVEGELWASLVDHIFNQLRLEDDSEKLVEQRRRHWLAKLDDTRAKMVRLESKRDEAERNLRDKERQAELLRRQRDSELDSVEHLRSQRAAEIVVQDSLDEVKGALAPLMVAVGVPTASEVFAKLDEARAELKRGRVLFDTLWSDTTRRRWVLAALVAVPVFVWVLSLADFSALATAFGGISAAAGSALVLLGKATGIVRSLVDKLDQAQSKVNEEITAVRQALNTQIQTAEENMKLADQRLKSVIDEQQTLNNDLKQIRDELEQVTPTRMLTDFVAERVGSGDYRKHLGIPALIQQDFRRLARLVSEQNEAILDDESGRLEEDSNCFNRIILYIDDLDRCPDERVVEVLQAVHLLLAFELFVVVVAVDSRWLSHALTEHFKALVTDRGNGSEATPDDYLEKIFQIPFWVQPLDASAKRAMVQRLLSGHLTGTGGEDGGETGGDKPTVGNAQRAVLAKLDPASAPPTLEAAALSIETKELMFLDSLAPLLGTTPRSTKRFVNLYQLVRIVYRLDPDTAPTTPPNDYQLLAFILALGEGLPGLGPVVLKQALQAKPSGTLEHLLENSRGSVDENQAKRLDEWLEALPIWKEIPAKRIADAFRKIDRFLFRVGKSGPPARDKE